MPFTLLALLLLFSGCVPQASVVRKSCGDCHQKDLQRYGAGVLHKPVADNNCEACHLPHGLIGALKLKTGAGGICFECHPNTKKELDKAHVHGPLKEGGCLKCHNPHDSFEAKGSKGMVRATGKDLCFICHAVDKIKKKTVHAAVDKGCDSCHVPHSSDRPRLMADDGNKLCVKCHDANSRNSRKGTLNFAGGPPSSCHTSRL